MPRDRAGRYRGGSGRAVFWVALIFIAALSTLWALASPIMSVPDENAHALKAVAQVHGQVIGYQVPGVKHTVVDLPKGYRYSQQTLCFATHPDQPANCGVELGDAGGQDWFNTWVGAYNPVYYYVVGWPSLILDGSAGIYAMRIVSGLIGSLFMAWAFQAAMSVRRARWMPLGLAFVATPMVVYLLGSVNPNGFEIAASAGLWIALLRLLQQLDGRDRDQVSSLSRRYLWFIVTVSAIGLAVARATGPLWVVVVVGLCFVAAGWLPVKRLFTTGKSYLWLTLIAAGGLFSILWTLGGGSLSSQASASDAPLVGGSFLDGFAHVLRSTPDYLQEAIGYFGWFDAPLRGTVYWLYIAAASILIFTAIGAANRRRALTLSAVIGAAVFVPALVQGYSVGQTGIIWQGRYGLFLYLGVTIVAAWVLSARTSSRADFLSTRFTWIGAGLLAVYGFVAFVVVMWRYVVGAAAPISEMWKNPAWQPPLGWINLVALYALVSLAFFVWVGWIAHRAVLGESAGREDRPDVDVSEALEQAPQSTTDNALAEPPTAALNA